MALGDSVKRKEKGGKARTPVNSSGKTVRISEGSCKKQRRGVGEVRVASKSQVKKIFLGEMHSRHHCC